MHYFNQQVCVYSVVTSGYAELTTGLDLGFFPAQDRVASFVNCVKA